MKKNLILAATLLCATPLAHAMSHTNPHFKAVNIINEQGEDEGPYAVIRMQPRKGKCGILALELTDELKNSISSDAKKITPYIEAWHIRKDGSKVKFFGKRPVGEYYSTLFGGGGHDEIQVECSLESAEADIERTKNPLEATRHQTHRAHCNKLFKITTYEKKPQACDNPAVIGVTFDPELNLNTK